MSVVAERSTGRMPGRSGAHPDTDRPIGPPTGRRDRRALMAVGSLVLVCVSIAAFAGLYATAGHRTAAVVVEHALVQGQPITAADLGQADVSVPGGVGYIPVADASTIAGKRAASDVPAGSLLAPADLTTGPPVVAGDAVVGLALKYGQFPASGLVPGRQVMVVQTGTPGSPLTATPTTGTSSSASLGTAASAGSAFTGSGTGTLVPAATVVGVAQPDANAGGGDALLVSVAVPSALAPDVVTASSADQVGLVLLPSGRAGSDPS